mgnify:CR=1 FL=1
MELKPVQCFLQAEFSFLLIVPYGIETLMCRGLIVCFPLLIVPYGIETQVINSIQSVGCLLIVPYGIETNIHELSNRNQEYF